MQPIRRHRKELVVGILTVWLASALGAGHYLSTSGQEHPKRDGDLKLTEPSLSEVRIEDNFWKPRIEVNRTRSLDHQYQECVQTGRIANFEVAAGLIKGKFQGRHYNDADVYKWIEGASYSLATHPDEKLDARLDAVISKIAAAQEKDGYLNTFIQLSYPEGRWANLGMLHELYNSGHLFEAAVAHHQATGKRSLLGVAIRLADCIDSVFGPGKRDGTSGHPEIELALVKLYRVTGERRYLRLAEFFLNQRGQKPSYFEKEYRRLDPSFTFEFKGETISHRTLNDRQFLRDPKKFDTRYCQDHLPVRQQSEVVGHAVRAMYLYSGMADVASETGDPGLLQALQRLHDNVTLKRMYLTGGLGPSKYNEGFTTDYDLPNDTAYQETC
ncbi:MAG TPA: beta-L-arabinofuranosidase domain-containing protein, partial [Terriglobia bacterium]|nr:beta-L-arabinofuranosidase domain-containing protein [Terriglobia bacterium]